MANGDVLKIKEVTRLPVAEVFTFLAYEQDVRVSENIKLDEKRK